MPLSKIDVYGKKIEMIKIEFKDYDENERNIRMKDYIEQIIAEIGSGENVERKKLVQDLQLRSYCHK